MRILGPLLLLTSALAPSCTCRGEKRELGLSHVRDAAPVIVIDSPIEGGGYTGPLAKEAEPNDQRDKAGALAAPGGVEGGLAAPTDVDFYRIEAGAARTLSVRLVGPNQEAGGADLVLDLYDADGKAIARSDRGPAGVLEALPNAALSGGKVYYVSVSQFVKKAAPKKKPKKGAAAEPASAADALARSYQLTADPVQPAAEDEIEPNDLPDGAREVLLSDEVSGFLGWTKDVDHWKLSLSGFAGGYVLDLAVDGVDGVPMVLELVAPDGRVLAARKSDKGRGVHIRGLLPEAGARYWLARLSGGRSNPEQPYRMRPVARELGDGDETEPNDVEESAMLVGPVGDGAEGTRRAWVDGGDMDFYRFEGVREPITLSLTVEPPGSIDVVLRVLKPGGKEVARADGGKGGQREELDVQLAAGEVLLVTVSGTALGDEPDQYALKWRTRAELAPPAPAPGEDDPPVEDPYEP